MRSILTSFLLALALGCSSSDGTESSPSSPLDAYCPIDSAEVESRVDAIVESLTLEEKAALMHGTSLLPVDGTWHSLSIPEKGIPGFRMLDGPKGVGGPGILEIANGANTTAFPVAAARAATWDPELEAEVGRAMARELRAVGGNVLLAPGLNIAWHPLSGRNQEYYGEDPFLSGTIGVGFVRGAQSGGVIATAKHYTANHIEDTRLEINAIVDERTLRENFLPQFRKVVQEGAVGSVMSAYNQVNGDYCSENRPLLGDILKGEWEFAGYVVSDFLNGTHNTVPAAEAGLDLEMMMSEIYGEPVVDAVTEGQLDEANVDEHVRRMLRAQLCYELDTNPPTVDESQLEAPETLALAREVAARATTLLRNEGDILPLSKSEAQSVVLVGPLADVENIGDLSGSSAVNTSEVVTIAEGLLARTDVAATIEYVEGDLSSPDDRATVSGADVVLVAVGLSEEDDGGEARDRESYGLSEAHEAFLEDVLELSDRVVVILEGGAAIDVTGWFEDTEAVLMAWYPGAQGGHAIANVLFGDVNPSARLPVTFVASLDDLQPFPRGALEATYEHYHGYQRLDRNEVSPFLPFGFGLSYTTFEYGDLTAEVRTTAGVESIELSFTVTNTGTRAGIETPQVYAGLAESEVDRPVRKLVGFARAELEPGASQVITVRVPVEELAYYEVGAGWVIEPGIYSLEVGPNVADLPLSVDVAR